MYAPRIDVKNQNRQTAALKRKRDMNGKFLDGPRTSRQDWLFALQRIFLITKVNRKSSQPDGLKQVLKGRDAAFEPEAH